MTESCLGLVTLLGTLPLKPATSDPECKQDDVAPQAALIPKCQQTRITQHTTRMISAREPAAARDKQIGCRDRIEKNADNRPTMSVWIRATAAAVAEETATLLTRTSVVEGKFP